jgi:conserved oligomeric Golgi complex subunit 2
MTSKFQLPSSTSQSPSSTPAFSRNSPIYSSDFDSDEDTLPYPAELPRSDFLAADFDPAHYLSTLRNRHQTLEDLRSDLRQRSQLLSKELLDLVNGNYEEFLSLGADLKGGEEKIEGVRVGLLGFQREVEGIRSVVEERQKNVGSLLEELKEVKKSVVLGRSLLEVDTVLGELEEDLGIRKSDTEERTLEDDFEVEDDETADDLGTSAPVQRLRRHTRQYILLDRTMKRVGQDHPFLRTQRSRVDEVQRTLLLDLAAGLRQAKGDDAKDAVLAIAGLFADLHAERGLASPESIKP